MRDLKEIVIELQRRKVHFEEGQLMAVLWDEACKELEMKGYREPLSVDDITQTMYARGEEVVKVANVLYESYDKIIEIDFYKTREEDEEVRD